MLRSCVDLNSLNALIVLIYQLKKNNLLTCWIVKLFMFKYAVKAALKVIKT